MARSKYDTNPLDHKVREAADEQMGSAEEDFEETSTRPMPASPAAFPAESPSQTNAYAPPAYASDRHMNASRFDGVYPSQQSQADASFGNWSGFAAHPPVVPPKVVSRPGLEIDANIEASLSYFPAFGALMAILVLVKEPTKNYFARFHAMQALILQGLFLVTRLLLTGLIEAFRDAGMRELTLIFAGLSGLTDVAVLAGLIYLGISAFRLKDVKAPGIGPLAEKHMEKL